MTLPAERTRAVIRTREFLSRLATPYGGGLKGVRGEVREQARRLLRHYPSWFDLGRADAFDASAASEIAAQEMDDEWLRSLDESCRRRADA